MKRDSQSPRLIASAARAAAATAAVCMLTAASCAAPATPGGADTTGGRARIIQLEADARALANTTGCASASQCRTAPVGSRPCGGPRTYLVYCAATTDSATLFKKLDELKAVETKFNQDAGLAGTCEFRMPPGVSVQGGSCREGSP